MPVLYEHEQLDTGVKGTIIWGDAFEQLLNLEPESVDLVFTSPNPFLSVKATVVNGVHVDPRTMGLEREIKHYLSHLHVICARIQRVMKPTASLWIHMADKGTYQHEMMQGIPERFFVDMITQWGWYAPDKPIWHRTEKSVRKNDRHLKRNWEPIYRFVKDPDLYYFNEKVSAQYPSVFSVPFDYPKEHSHNVESGFPEELVEAAIRTCLNPSDSKQTVLDPFAGTGTTALVAKRMHKSFILMDISERRCQAMAGRLGMGGGGGGG